MADMDPYTKRRILHKKTMRQINKMMSALFAAAARLAGNLTGCTTMQTRTIMRKNCGTRWTQQPLFCGTFQQTEQKPASPAPLNNEHTAPLADFICDIDAKTTARQLWTGLDKHCEQIITNLSMEQQGKLAGYFKKKAGGFWTWTKLSNAGTVAWISPLRRGQPGNTARWNAITMTSAEGGSIKVILPILALGQGYRLGQ